jgi:hypothetical protein
VRCAPWKDAGTVITMGFAIGSPSSPRSVEQVFDDVSGDLGGRLESLRRARIGVPQADLVLGLGERALVLEEARRARQPLGGMADDGLSLLHRHDRGHGDLAFGLPRLVDGLALAHEFAVLEARHRDATLGGAQIDADGRAVELLRRQRIAQVVKHRCCHHRTTPRQISSPRI